MICPLCPLISMVASMITGRHVLFALIGFFGVVFAVNGVFVYVALGTFDGVQSENAYIKGRFYNKEIARAEAQAKRGWTMDVESRATGDGALAVAAQPKDAEGKLLSGLAIEAKLVRPTNAGLDQRAALVESQSGLYRGSLPVPEKGQWLLEIAASENGAVVYRAENRIVVK